MDSRPTKTDPQATFNSDFRLAALRVYAASRF